MNTPIASVAAPIAIPPSPASTSLAEIVAMRQKADELEAQLVAEQNAKLVALPAQFGYADAKSFLKAFNAANGGKVTASSTRKARVSLTPEKRKEIVAYMKQNKGTQGLAALAAEKFGISISTANNIKADAGLVEKRD